MNFKQGFGCALMLLPALAFVFCYIKFDDINGAQGTTMWLVFFIGVWIATRGIKQEKNKWKKKELEFEEVEKKNKEKEKSAITIKKPEFVDKNYQPTTVKNQKDNTTYTNNHKSNEMVEEPVNLIDNYSEIIESPIEVKVKKRENKTEKLPEAKPEKSEKTGDILYVNYDLNLNESTENYPVLRIPKRGCVVRSHRFGNTKRRGFKEESFQRSIQQYFGSKFIVSGDVRLNTGKETRPFEPDIAIIDNNSKKNIRIDIEIDEPYAGITRQPTHCAGEDYMRDTYFTDRGWIVVRFSEYQVHTQELYCLNYLAKIINSIIAEFFIPAALITYNKLKIEKLWDVVQAQKWEKENYRENYLNHIFKHIPEEIETIERDFNNQEIFEENLVKPSIVERIEDENIIGFNSRNIHSRDKRVKFYPEPHLYTIDNVPAPSASTIISKFFPEFDAYSAALNLNPNHELFGLEIKEIIEIWRKKGQEAAELGTQMHKQVENFYLKNEFVETKEFNLFQQFVKAHPNLNPYRSEWRIFDEEYHIAGTIDLIVKNGTQYEIYDWKRSKKVIDTWDGSPITLNTFGRTGVGDLNHISDTCYNHYCLQQSLYKYILEKNYGIRISKMFLVVLYPDYDRYYKVEASFMPNEIQHILNSL